MADALRTRQEATVSVAEWIRLGMSVAAALIAACTAVAAWRSHRRTQATLRELQAKEGE